MTVKSVKYTLYNQLVHMSIQQYLTPKEINLYQLLRRNGCLIFIVEYNLAFIKLWCDICAQTD